MELVSAFTITGERPLRLTWVRVMQDGDRLMPSPVGTSVDVNPMCYEDSVTPLDGYTFQLEDGRRARVSTRPPLTWQGGFVGLTERIRQLKAQNIWLPGFEGRPAVAMVPGAAPAVPAAGELRLLEAIRGLDGKLDRVLAILKP